MKFYKLLCQNNKKESLISAFFDSHKHNYVKGMHSNSIAVEYSPNSYFDFISNEKIFTEFQKRYIKQLFITNQKFIGISKYEKEFNLKLENCYFDNVDNEEIFMEYFEESDSTMITYELIEDILSEHELQISEMTYRMMGSKKKIIIQKNGVLGMDDHLEEEEQKYIKKLIDTLNIGIRVLNHETTYH